MNASVAPIRTKAETALVETFAALRGRLPGAGPAAALRVESFEAFARAGLPNRRVEAWHFTDLRAAMREAFSLAEPPGRPAAPATAALAPDAIRLALVDGALLADLSDLRALPAGLRVRALAEALAEADAAFIEALAPPGLVDDPIVALNAALMAGGVVIDVAPGAQIERPVQIDWIGAASAPCAVFARSLIRLGEGARLTLFEADADAAAARQINSVVVAALGAHARLDHVRATSGQAAGSLQIETFLASLGAGARLVSSALVSGSPFLRRQTHVRFDGAGADAQLTGLSLLRGAERADNTLLVAHAAPQCRSREVFKHVVDEQANAVFQGKIVVAPGAQKTDGAMASRAILLSDEAGMDNKPELEIFADDVVCGHGATCGELDGDQLFYAMARGLPRPQAEALLLEAFAGEALDAIVNEAAREALKDRMRRWLGERGI